MSNKLLYLSLAVLAAGCSIEVENPFQEEPIEVQSGKELVTIYASLNDETKTTVDGTGVFSWQTDEKISVVEEDATSGADFTLTDAATGAFTGTKSDGKDLVFAVSPKDALTDVDFTGGLTYEISLPATYTNYVPGTTNSIMVGTPNGGSYKFKFYNAAALMKFTYANVPIGTKKFVYGSTENNLTGSWIFDTTSGVVLDGASATGSEVTLELAEAVYEANQTLEFCVPVPTATYKDFLIELQDKDGNTLSGTDKSKDGLSLALYAGSILPLPTVNLAEATKGANWTYTFSAASDLVAGGTTLNGRTVSSSPAAGGWESSRGAQYASGADPVITINNSDYVENVILVLSTNAGADKVKVVVKVDGIQLGDEQTVSTTDNQSYTFAVDDNHYRKGNVTIHITNSNNSKSSYIKTVTINDKSPAGLSYDAPAAYSVLESASFVAPTLNNPNSLSPITYSSSDTDVASVDSGTGAVTVKTKKGTTTITASFAGNASYKAGTATYTITVADPYIDLPAETTPAKANCADDSTVTFDVDSNLEWTATKGTDTEGIIKSVSQSGSTVTVTFNANSDKTDKSAQVNITPDDDTYSSTATYMTVTQRGDRIEDILTYALIAPSSGSGYQTFSGRSYAGDGHSEAVYAGKICVNSDDKIQFNNDSNAGIVTTTSGGAIEKVAITWYSGSAGLTIDVYGKNTAYSSAADLFDENKGTKLGSLVKGTNDEITISGYYEYIGIVPATSGARYLSSITTTWGPAKDDNDLEWQKSSSKITTDSATMITGDDTMPTATLYNPHSLTVSYSSSETDVATINPSTGAINLVGGGSTSITATFAGDATYRPGAVSYTLTVTDSRTICDSPTFSETEGPVAADTDVTISSTTTGSTIYYTTDGSTPTTESAHGTVGDASAIVTIDVAMTVKAIAVKDDYKTSSVASAAYTISGAATPLPAPSSVSVTSISTTSFTATWANDSNASGYSWMLSTSSTAPASTSDESVKAYGTGSDGSLTDGTWTLTKSSLSLDGIYYFYVKAVGDGSVYSDSGYTKVQKVIITLNCSSNIFGLRTDTGNDASTETSKTVNGFTYKLYASDACYYYGSKALFIGKGGSYITFPAISGVKLTSVSASNCTGASAKGSVSICPTSGTTPTTGGTASTIAAGGSKTWTLTATTENTAYRIYINNSYNLQYTNITLIYSE